MIKLTTFRLNSTKLNMWLHQNKAEVDDIVEGCLLDNLLVLCKRGKAAVYEHYLNTNASDYLIVFAPYTNIKSCERITVDFYNRLKNAGGEL